ncbi:peptidoglycan-binding protein, partial [Bacillus subtilis]
ILSEGRWGEVKAAIEAELKALGGKSSSKKTTSSNAVKKPSSSKKKSSFNLPSGIFKVKSPLMHSAAVEQIQTALAALHFYPDKKAKNFGIDSYYGPKTANAVKRFQSIYGLTADGIYGPKTKTKLETLLR